MAVRPWLGGRLLRLSRFLHARGLRLLRGYYDNNSTAADMDSETWDLPMSNTIVINTHGMDTASAAAAVERVWRRRDLDQQRRGGFGR